MRTVTEQLLRALNKAEQALHVAAGANQSPTFSPALTAAVEAIQEARELIASDKGMSGRYTRPYVDLETRRKRQAEAAANGTGWGTVGFGPEIPPGQDRPDASKN